MYFNIFQYISLNLNILDAQSQKIFVFASSFGYKVILFRI